MSLLSANATELHFELRGTGPPLLLIMGATGYGGVFDRFAELLADDFTIVTSDRRGNGRSPRPSGWRSTSTEEHADDAAALLSGLGVALAAIFGTSSGALFALAALIRHPRSVRGAVLHETSWIIEEREQHVCGTRCARSSTMACKRAGPPQPLERFVRFVAGDANWQRLDPGVRKGMLASADTYFGVESGAFDSDLPAHGTLASIKTPIGTLASAGSHLFFTEAANRLARGLGVEVTRTRGTHFSYLDHPDELAESVKLFLGHLDS
jgi:pimeloyl-ACP methyl ester carboxylesterase